MLCGEVRLQGHVSATAVLTACFDKPPPRGISGCSQVVWRVTWAHEAARSIRVIRTIARKSDRRFIHVLSGSSNMVDDKVASARRKNGGLYADIFQLVEYRIRTAKVPSSSLGVSSIRWCSSVGRAGSL